jgi:hypothetical protein
MSACARYFSLGLDNGNNETWTDRGWIGDEHGEWGTSSMGGKRVLHSIKKLVSEYAPCEFAAERPDTAREGGGRSFGGQKIAPVQEKDHSGVKDPSTATWSWEWSPTCISRKRS